METPLQKLLNDWRNSAISRDWEGTLEATQKVLEHVGFSNAMRVGIAVVGRHLDHFEEIYPDKTWPRECLQRLAHVADGTEAIDGRLEIPADALDFPEAGFNGFITSVEDLWEAAAVYRPAYARHVTDAISGAVMSEALEEWGKVHSTKWTEWLNSSEEDKTRKPLDFWRDPGVQQAIQDIWIAIAQSTERLVRQR